MSGPAVMDTDSIALARAMIADRGRSFALASKLLRREVRDEVLVLYAYCRRVDDAIDSAHRQDQARALSRLRAELDQIYEGRPVDPLLTAVQALVRARGIPREYPEELLAGMEMDVSAVRYDTLEQLFMYAYRVAGVVGLMMCHVIGVRGAQALPHAAHLGIAMQLTNIVRDVAEDWQLGRLYLPAELLARHGVHGLAAELGTPLPDHAREGVGRAMAELLAYADAYYRSGQQGLRDLSPRTALAIDAAQLIYSDIGRAVRVQRCDPSAGRATVSTSRKLSLIALACVRALGRLPRAWHAPRVATPALTLPRQAALALPGGRW